MYRVLATQLARQGYPTLRFDYSCSGDSLGASEAASLDGWIQDVSHAVEALRDRTAARRIALMGLRLGASVAALAVERQPTLGQHLLLWDPVIDGVAYLTELARAHRQHLESELSQLAPSQVPPSVAPREVLGHPLSSGFAQALQRVELAALQWPAEHVSVICTQENDRVRRLRDRLTTHAQCEWVALTSSAAWNSDAALNDAVVPMDVVEAVVASIRRVSP